MHTAPRTISRHNGSTNMSLADADADRVDIKAANHLLYNHIAEEKKSALSFSLSDQIKVLQISGHAGTHAKLLGNISSTQNDTVC